MDFSVALQIFFSGLNLGSIYAALGLGFFVVYSVTRVLNLAQGEFVMLGGMLTVSFYTMGIPLAPSILLAVVITALAGAGLYRFTIYPARKSSGVTKVFPTLGFAFVTDHLLPRPSCRQPQLKKCYNHWRQVNSPKENSKC